MFTLRPFASVLLALTGLVSATASHATGAVWDTTAPWGSDATVLAEWNLFGGSTDSSPDVSGSGTVTETTGTSFVTGSGNIYGFTAPAEFTVSTTGIGSVADVWLRIATLGTEASVTATLNGIAATLVQQLSGSSGSGFGGAEVEAYWVWTDVNASVYDFAFSASGTHMSLDQLAVAAAPVPEPASMAMLTAGLGLLVLARHKRLRATAPDTAGPTARHA